MGRQTQTKLFKRVSKQAAKIRSQFYNPLSNVKDGSSVKKSPVNKNKIGERFRLKMIHLSFAKTWPEIRKVSFTKKYTL